MHLKLINTLSVSCNSPASSYFMDGMFNVTCNVSNEVSDWNYTKEIRIGSSIDQMYVNVTKHVVATTEYFYVKTILTGHARGQVGEKH